MKILWTMKIVIIASSVQQCEDQMCNVYIYIYIEDNLQKVCDHLCPMFFFYKLFLI
jgi:hypothetical protein